MRPKIFIGSSTENLKTAYAIQEHLEFDSEPTVWTDDIFKLSDYALNSLIDKLQNFDFGVFIFSPDDTAIIRKQERQIVRDNIIFELGLFIGHLGKERSFIVCPRSVDDFHLPTDLLGINPANYDSQREDIKAALGPACNKIRNSMKELGLRHSEQEEKIIHMSLGDERIFDKLNEARSIDIMSNTAKGFIKKYSNKIIDAMDAYECKVRILLSNPKSNIWDAEAICNGLCPGINIQTEIDDVLRILNYKVRTLEQNKNKQIDGSLEVKTYSNVPTCSLIIIDNEIARFTPYLPFAHSTEVPIYDVMSKGKPELLTQLQKTFDRVWNSDHSKTILIFGF